VSEPAGLEFPTDYPVKVLGRPQPGFRERVHAILLRHAPAVGPEQVSERRSAKGNFLSSSYQLRAESRAQIEALVSELRGCEGVLMLI
jgi:putative lipoic acid-binding regulatory protein